MKDNRLAMVRSIALACAGVLQLTGCDARCHDVETTESGEYTLADHFGDLDWGHAMLRPVPGLLFGGALKRARAVDRRRGARGRRAREDLRRWNHSPQGHGTTSDQGPR